MFWDDILSVSVVENDLFLVKIIQSYLSQMVNRALPLRSSCIWSLCGQVTHVGERKNNFELQLCLLLGTCEVRLSLEVYNNVFCIVIRMWCIIESFNWVFNSYVRIACTLALETVFSDAIKHTFTAY